MSPEKKQQIKQVFNAALDLSVEERPAFLENACHDDVEMRRQVEFLLSSFDSNFADNSETDITLTPQPNFQLTAGQKLSHYEIKKQLGTGGMGEVYLAEDTKLNRQVAIKILKSSSDTHAQKRLLQEAQSAAVLDHPNICTVYEVGEENEIPFIAMHYIEGETLAEKLKRGAFPVDEAVSIAAQIADALHEAHSHGIIHRDIKPTNIIVTPRGQIKVLDFSLAKKVFFDHEGETEKLLSQPGVIIGTIAYMSPEQARGQVIDGRSDIWSLGAILYEMLTGKIPFYGDTASDLIAGILKTEVPFVPEIKAKIPLQLEQIVLKTLAKKREERYQTAEELLADLKSLQKSNNNSIEFQSRTDNRTVFWVLASVFALLIAAFGFYWLITQKPVSPFAKAEIKSITTSGNIIESAISPDGKLLAVVKSEQGKQSLWLRQILLRTGENRLTEPTDEAVFTGLSFSPDGSHVFYTVRQKNNSVNQLFAVPILGSQPPKAILNDVDSPLAFAPDGKHFAFMRRNTKTGITALMISSDDGTEVKELLPKKSPFDFMLRPIAWSPNGKTIACILNVDLGGTIKAAQRQIVEVDAQTGVEKIISPQAWSTFESIAWLKNGDSLIFTATEPANPLQISLWYMPYPAGNAKKISSDLMDYRNVSIAKNTGDIVLRQSQNETNVWLVDLKSPNSPRRISQTKADGSNGVAWTPDNSLIFSSNINGTNYLQKTPINNATASSLTNDDRVFSHPCATSDGKYIVFTSTQNNAYRIWRVDASGANLTQLTSNNGEYLSCSPDSRWVYYNALTEGKSSVWRISVDGGEPQKLTEQITFRPEISPDGSKYAAYYRADANSPWQIAVFLPNEDKVLSTIDLPKSVSLNASFAWTPDSKGLIFIQTKDGVANLWKFPFDGQPPTQLSNFNDETLPLITDFSLSPSGEQVALVRGRRTSDVVQLINTGN